MTVSRETSGIVRRARREIGDHRYRLLAGTVALAAAAVVLWVATDLFPYHSANHDEGVYLQQAAMLLEGRLWLTPGSEPLREAFHPWFFVESPRGLYPKYAPVPAAVFAAGKLAGGYRLALAGVAAANVALCYGLTAAAFDRPTGVLAGATMAAAPLFVLPSSVFLPYAPTTALNLLFALAYVRSVRRDSRRYAALAGLAAGLAFFARPYTAVVFASPFLAHACWRFARAIPDDFATVARYATTATVGLALVGVTLAYNAVMTGSPLTFPYEAFAPLDGLGFGRRRILGHEVTYTPSLALRANADALGTLATDWFTAGPLGTAAAVGGVAAVLARTGRRAGSRLSSGTGSEDENENADAATALPDRHLRLLLLGVAAAVVAGNVYFWGTLNIVGDVGVPGDGFVSRFGPFYHFDLLLPLSACSAHGVVAGARWLRDRAAARVSARTVRVGALVALAVTLPVVGAASAGAFGPPVERNGAYTGKLAGAYAPFEATDLEGALVFVPPEYGEWRNHPFQWLRNDPGFDGSTVYALSRTPDADLAVADAYPGRSYYRYRYHGEWTPDPDERVVPVLERLRLREAPALHAQTTVTVPDRIVRASVAVSNGETVRRHDYRGDPPPVLSVNWTLAPGGATVSGRNLTDGAPVPITGADRIALTVTITEPSGATLTYRETVTVRTTDAGVEALWPPATSVCTLVTDCGLAGTYVPDRPGTRPAGISTNTTLVERSSEAGSSGGTNRTADAWSRRADRVGCNCVPRRPHAVVRSIAE